MYFKDQVGYNGLRVLDMKYRYNIFSTLTLV